MSEESYQALLQQARARAASLDSAHCAARRKFEELGATDPGLAGFLDTMMSQLLSKSVLYEPLQQINARARGLHLPSCAVCSYDPRLSTLPTWPRSALRCLLPSWNAIRGRAALLRRCWPCSTRRPTMWSAS